MSQIARHTWRYGAISYSVGLALIFSATVLNLCLHKLPPKHLYSLPDFLVYPYERAGNLGVTLTVAGVGMMLVMIGMLGTIIAGRSSRTGGTRALTDSAMEMDYARPHMVASSEVGGSSGTLVLESAKYLGKKPSALPGSTILLQE